MLASTVQFSKYGRSQLPDRRVPQLSELEPSGGRLVLAEGGLTPVPSGPNSVPGLHPVRPVVPSRKRAY
jgi:hypothetical protein